MLDRDLLANIIWAMRRVPRLRNGWRYIPLHQLPKGTEITIKAADALSDPEPRSINGRDEVDILRLGEGQYTLRILVWPTVLFSDLEQSLEVKPHNVFLAPTSIFEANVDLPNPNRESRNDNQTTTFRLTTGKIGSILIPGTHFVLKDEDSQPREKHVRT